MEAKQDERFTVFGCFAVAADAAVAAGNQAEEADIEREGRRRQGETGTAAQRQTQKLCKTGQLCVVVVVAA